MFAQYKLRIVVFVAIFSVVVMWLPANSHVQGASSEGWGNRFPVPVRSPLMPEYRPPLFPATQRAKLLAEDKQAEDNFGYSVAISGDGKTILIGAPYDDEGKAENNGAAYVFTQDSGTWKQSAILLVDTRTSDTSFGSSVALSRDGNTALIGAEREGDHDTGSAYIFTRVGEIWEQQARFVGTDSTAEEYFGASVALSADGETGVVGAFREDCPNEDSGAVYIFARSGTKWQLQQKVTSFDDPSVADDLFGFAVSISGDGDTILIGAFQNDEDETFRDRGAAYVFTRSNNTWNQQAKLLADDSLNFDYFGNATALSNDGNTALIGAYGKDSPGILNNGAVYVFTRVGSTWKKQARLQARDKLRDDWFGNSLALSSNGNIALIGAYVKDDKGEDVGAAYVFTRSGSAWVQRTKLSANDKAVKDQFGYSVSLSEDASIAVMGAFQEDSDMVNNGAAYVFTGVSTASGTVTKTPVPPRRSTIDLFDQKSHYTSPVQPSTVKQPKALGRRCV